MWHQVGIGLAAPQVGMSLRIFVMDDGKGGARALVNPVVTERGRRREGGRGLPVLARHLRRRRAQQVAAHRGRSTGTASRSRFEAQGLQAKIIQHELDHLDGVLFIDRLPPVTRDRIKKKIQKEGLAPEGRRHHAFAL